MGLSGLERAFVVAPDEILQEDGKASKRIWVASGLAERRKGAREKKACGDGRALTESTVSDSCARAIIIAFSSLGHLKRTNRDISGHM